MSFEDEDEREKERRLIARAVIKEAIRWAKESFGGWGLKKIFYIFLLLLFSAAVSTGILKLPDIHIDGSSHEEQEDGPR